jgi:hypothetical protein
MKKLIELSVEGAKIIDLCIEGDKLIEAGTAGVYNKSVKGVKVNKGRLISRSIYRLSNVQASPSRRASP